MKKTNEMPELYIIFARKITKHPNFYDICQKRYYFARKNARILRNTCNCPKNIFPEYWATLPSVSYAYGWTRLLTVGA